MKTITKALALLLACLLLLSACSTEPTPSGTTGTETAAESAATLPQSSSEQAPETVPGTESAAETGTESGTEPVPEHLDLGGFGVSSSTKEATAAGMEILKKGGNAIDAAVAVALALGVTEPYSSGLGGSGVMVVYDPATDTAFSLDYYACAGSATQNTDFVGVPGFLSGMQEALDRWGSMSLAQVIEPAIELAEKGFPATALFARRLDYSAKIRQNPAFRSVRERNQFLEFAVIEDQSHYRMALFERNEYFLGRGVLTCLGFLGLRIEFEFVEKQFAHLPRTIDIKRLFRQVVYPLLQVVQFSRQRCLRLFEFIHVDTYPGCFHLAQHRHQRQFHFVIQIP